MKRTYDQTWTKSNEKLQQATIRVDVYKLDKYSEVHTVEEVERDMRTVHYTGLTSWDVISGGPEADEIEADLNEQDFDEHHEYLVLHFNDDSQATFRNSHVDMFIH